MKQLLARCLCAAVTILLASLATVILVTPPANWHVVDYQSVAAPDSVSGPAPAAESSFASERLGNIFASLGASNNQEIVAALKALGISVGANAAPAMLVAMSHRSQMAVPASGSSLIPDGFGDVSQRQAAGHSRANPQGG